MDENYQTYLNRAMRLTLPETYRNQVQHIQESAKFRPDPDSGRQPVPFPGYSIVTPPAVDETQNQALYASLQQYQQQITQTFDRHFFAPVPPDSFHLTLADLIWDSAYLDAAATSDFDLKLRACIAQIFNQCQPLHDDQPIQFQVIGLIVMTRALAVCLVPTEEAAYDRILKFRRAIYQNQELIGLGVEQQYYFTPHITLGYFGTIPPAEARLDLSHQFDQLNQQWLNQQPQGFWVHQAELRKFNDMTRYDRESDWPVFQF